MKDPIQIIPRVIDTPLGPRFAPPEGCSNLKISLSYDGSDFNGWQTQPHGNTVQDVLTQAWRTLTHEDTPIQGCSRLDTGVHAMRYVANLYTRTEIPTEKLLRSLNGILRGTMKRPVGIYSIEDAPPEFHARFDSCGKHYRYLLWYGFGIQTQLTSRAWAFRNAREPTDLDVILKMFEGTHDFDAFRASDCTAKTTVRSIRRIRVVHHPLYPELVILDFFGDGFLKNMIRNIVGSAVEASVGRISPDLIAHALRGKVARKHLGPCAPAHGLMLMNVFHSDSEYRVASASDSINVPI